MGKDEEQNQSISDDQELAKVLAGIGGDDAAATDQAAAATPPVAQAEPEVSTEEQTLPAPAAADSLDSIKKEALGELRPLVDKLNVEPDEKFDIYLLMLRSTDDKELIAPAHEAAKAIPDEGKRAQALLDVIKEIDFLTQPPKEEEAPTPDATTAALDASAAPATPVAPVAPVAPIVPAS